MAHKAARMGILHAFTHRNTALPLHQRACEQDTLEAERQIECTGIRVLVPSQIASEVQSWSTVELISGIAKAGHC